MLKLEINEKDKEHVEEYCITKETTLEPLESYDIQPKEIGKKNIYIPSSDILFMREQKKDQNSVRIAAYNIEFGIWTHSDWTSSENDIEDLKFHAFRLNIEAMFDKIAFAIKENKLDSIFDDGEDFLPSMRGINTKIQAKQELSYFKAKVVGQNKSNQSQKEFSNFFKQSIDYLIAKFKKEITASVAI